MSADNYVGVFRYTTLVESPWAVAYGSASIQGEDCQYRGSLISEHRTRAKALLAAHDYAKSVPVLEYGVIELATLPAELCGRCFVCVNERGIIAPDIERCDKCHKPFTTSDWITGTAEGNFHRSCEPDRLSG